MSNKPPAHRRASAPPRDRGYDRAYNRTRGDDPRRLAAWRNARALKLARDPLCEECRRAGVVRPAQQVHHVVSLDRGGALLDLDNLMSVCTRCHARTSARERRK